MRCLALADVLTGRGCEVRFVTAAMPTDLIDLIEVAGHEVRMIEPSDSGADRPDWDRTSAAPDEQQSDAAATLAALGDWRADWLAADNYRFDEHWEREARGSGARLLVVDDLANRRHDCDMLLDHTAGREADEYRPFVPDDAELLIGADFALLRPEFEAARPRSLERRRSARPDRLLVSLGSTDIGGLTAKVLEALVQEGIGAHIDVVLGSEAAPSLPRVSKLADAHSNITLHHRPESMAGLMAAADLAVGAAGTTSWERCCLGLPSVTLIIADNQQTVARNLETLDAIIAVPDWTEVAPAVRDLLSNPRRLQEMSAVAAAIVDGKGAQRVAVALLGDPVPAADTPSLRPATADDSETLWLWRNDPLMRRMAKSQGPIPWSAHDLWYRRALSNARTVILIGEIGGTPVGMVRFDPRSDGSFLVSINLDPHRRGRGLGTKLLAAGCDRFLEKMIGVKLCAEIDRSNAASERIFERIGFVPARGDEAAQYRTYVRPGDPA